MSVSDIERADIRLTRDVRFMLEYGASKESIQKMLGISEACLEQMIDGDETEEIHQNVAC